MAPVVRAKFKCWSIEHEKSPDPQYNSAKVTLDAVYEDGKGVNQEWSQWTPAGQIVMHITNPAAIERFEQGKEYFVDFTPAE